MRFRVLGTLEVRSGGRPVPLAAAKQRTLLAVLLLKANRPVDVGRLVDALWPAGAPRSASVALRTYVSALRRALGLARAAGLPRLDTVHGGYQLHCPPADLDLLAFEDLAAQGRQALADGQPALAAERLRHALDLWRGRPFEDVDLDPGLRAELLHLEERRLAVQESWAESQLLLGHHEDVLAELGGLVAAQPLREQLWAKWMLALHRSGRRAEALRAYQDLRARLVGELGIEPSPPLRRLHERILTNDIDQTVPPASTAPVPRQLPADVGGFTGRDAELARLFALADDHPDALAVCAVDGMAGIGKTALAVHWAHRVRHDFPDGQLYVDLRGYAAGPPLRPIDALARFLPALGMPAEQVPVDADEAATLYRSLLADKRVLVLLDNARHADQVRPLLPGAHGCLVIVTSRDRLSGLLARDGAVRLPLHTFTPAESRALLARQLGSDRVRAEARAAGDLARLCGHLPLALRIAAANLITHPTVSIAGYAARLANGDRLTALQADDDPQAAVRAAFEHSYAALPDAARHLFRSLGLAPGPDLTAEAAAALAGIPPGQAVRLLDRLARAHLVDEHVAGRYAVHDLLRHYATEQTTAEDDAEDRRAAVERLLGHYLHAVDVAAEVLYPDKLRLPGSPEPAAADFDSRWASVGWLDAERPNLVAAVLHAAEHGPHRIACRLADALRGYFELRMHTVSWLAVANAALLAATADHDVAAQAAAHLSLANLHASQSRSPQAVDHYTAALDLSRRAGWHDGHAAAHGNLGVVHQQSGQLAQAAKHYLEAFEIHPRTSYHGGTANGLGNLGRVYHQLGRLDDARTTLTRALALMREVGTRGGEAEILHALAAERRDNGHLTEAVDLATEALALARDVGDLRCEADALNALAAVHDRAGRHDQAVEDHRRALELAREIGNRHTETEALIGLSTAHRHAGRPEPAFTHARAALTIADQGGFRVLTGQALTAVAAAHLDRDRPDLALDLAEQAMAVHTETGHRVGMAHSHLVAGHALRHLGDDNPSHDHLRRAAALFAEIGVDPAAHAPAYLGPTIQGFRPPAPTH